MIRTLVFAVAVCCFAWLTYESVQFREQIWVDLREAQAEGQRLDPEFAGGAGKVLNFYYESVYRDLPNTLVPASASIICAFILLLSGGRSNT